MAYSILSFPDGQCRKRLFLFDYDGTLADIVTDPSKALLSQPQLTKLRTLASGPKNAVWIISGRDQAFLQTQLGQLPEIGLVAEHGAFMRRPWGTSWEDLTTGTDLSWQLHVKKVFNTFLWTPPMMVARVEEKKTTVVLDFQEEYDQASAQLRVADLKKELEENLQEFPVQFIQGKYNLEARPAIVSKGVISTRIYTQMQPGSPDIIFCAGDDMTDEGMSIYLHRILPLMWQDMFVECLRLAHYPYTVKVGGRRAYSNAEYCLDDPAAVWAYVDAVNDYDKGSSGLFPVPRSDLLPP